MAELSTLGAPIATAYEGQSNTNAYDDAAKAKVDGITTVGAFGNTFLGTTDAAAGRSALALGTGDLLLMTAAERAAVADAVLASDGTTVSPDIDTLLNAADFAAARSALGVSPTVALTQTAYDALTPDAGTTYLITGA